MNVDVGGTDTIVSEYLIYRGFTQTYQTLEHEKGKDRLKKFDVSRIVETIFTSLTNFQIENFISLWDFLNKRFFFHLNVENLALCGVLKSDLLKFYLVHACKTKNKDRITEFFSAYSHEILADAGDLIPGNLRNWYVLPYMDEPEKDAEFSVHFSEQFEGMLSNTLHNFLSTVLASAPAPKLLLLEKWFRSEAQQEIRSQLKQYAQQVEALQYRLQKRENQVREYWGLIQDLVAALHRVSMDGRVVKNSGGSGSGGSSCSSGSSSSSSGSSSSSSISSRNMTKSESAVADQLALSIKEAGEAAISLSSSIARQTPDQESSVWNSSGSAWNNVSASGIVDRLHYNNINTVNNGLDTGLYDEHIEKVQRWLQLLSLSNNN